MPYQLRSISLLMLSAILAGCGSGGSGGSASNTSPSNTSPSNTQPSSSAPSSNTSSAAQLSSESSSSRAPYTESLADTPIATPADNLKASPTTITRLNRAQYNNTVRDLLGTNQTPADTFPEDDFGDGFNSIGDSLSVSGLHLEQYHAAALSLLSELVTPATSSNHTVNALDLGANDSYNDTGFAFTWNGDTEFTWPFNPPSPGRYTLSVEVAQQPRSDDPHNVASYITLDKNRVLEAEVTGTTQSPQIIELDLNLSDGQNLIAVGYSNSYDPVLEIARPFGVKTLSLTGPHATVGQMQFQCKQGEEENSCAERILETFSGKAWRRPLTSEETQSLVRLYDASLTRGSSHGEALKDALTAVLLSPYFIYRPEIDNDLNSSQPRDLNAYELASRLSYFLWASTPDDELLSKAEDGSLTDEQTLLEQIDRMLADERAQTLVEYFAVQWLKFDKVLDVQRNSDLFPTYGAELVDAMRTESRLFLSKLIFSNAPISQLFTANFTYLNRSLAQHYGITGSNYTEDAFTRHEWNGGDRRGILGQASVLTATAHPSSTSPVKRGVWVLENLLCEEPPPPPPGVENIAESNDLSGLTTRERFTAHSENVACAGCHRLMDPIGFGLENYNPVGQWRDTENGLMIDAEGVIPVDGVETSGANFNGGWELGQLLASSPRLPLCTAEHLLTYALGRGVHAFTYGAPSTEPTASGERVLSADYALVHSIYEQTKESNHGFIDLIKAVALSPAFRSRVPATLDAPQGE